ncbi:MAG TPA: PHB depolymerase family esterase [Mesorhizobium sp.]|jgi:poly(hydroxyalkanoate) depolymerase family esterase|nr:PHB depolymerase family esterase [Mesorhizobium sp.]
MRGLSDTIARLNALRALHGPGGSGGPSRLSPLTGFGSNPGALNGWAYLPARLEAGAPLVVVLHGCTQTAAGYDHGSGWSTLADRHGFALLFPEQTRANNPNLCFNWFLGEDTRRGEGEVLSIARMIEAVAKAHAIDRRRVFITGLSAGGAMTAAMLAAYPELFAGGAIIAGLPYGVATTVPEALDRMRGHGMPHAKELQRLLRGASNHSGPWPTLSLWHGAADRTVASANMDAIVDQWRAAHGLRDAPEQRELVDGHVRHVWRDASGREAIEAYSITGMGHGTPLSTMGEDGYGASAPFMLEAGISSTLRIARFWGIADAAGHREPAAAAHVRPSPGIVHEPQSGKGWPERLRSGQDHGRRRHEAAPEAAGSKLGRVIEDALRKAGLMR